jgi:23S rRNA (cytidine1920-2'-O)/16S rRNA (cytidine1409-2'-O)-methyltransferase
MTEETPYVSRAGLKLEAALRAFGIDVSGFVCCDFGSHTGGFVDCLLQHGAARVYAVEPGYGVLDYNLRRDPRVVVCERTNALRYIPPERCDLVTIDVGWTQQRLILPAARRCLKPGGHVITLVKPQYEAPKEMLVTGLLPPARLAPVLGACRAEIEQLGWSIRGQIESPIRGHGGNTEYVLWLSSKENATETRSPHQKADSSKPAG